MKKTAHLFRGAFYVLLLPLVAVYEIQLALGQWQAAAPPSSKNPTGGICFSPAWTAGPDMPSTGVRMVGVYFPANGKFYAVGGHSMDGVGNEYDPSANSWAIKSASHRAHSFRQ